MKLPLHIHQSLDRLERAHQLREIPQPSSELIDFCSNDYLGLARSAETMSGKMEGATGARLLRGTLSQHLELEALCAEIFKAEACLLFNSGYQANVGLLSCLGQRNDTYLYDEACHASLKDGMRLSNAKRYAFRHNDLSDLKRLLENTTGNRFIVVESLYSMDGDWCDLREISALAKHYGAWIVLDEAHSTGIVGKSGGGYAVEKGIENAVFLRIITFGKALGRMGAVIAGPRKLRDYLVNRSRAWIYSTAMPGLLAQSIVDSLQQMQQMEAERERLVMLRREMEKALYTDKIATSRLASPIIPLMVPGNVEAKNFANGLQAAGFDARAILAPTVATGTERIRIVLHSFNKVSEVQHLAKTIKKLRES